MTGVIEGFRWCCSASRGRVGLLGGGFHVALLLLLSGRCFSGAWNDVGGRHMTSRPASKSRASARIPLGELHRGRWTALARRLRDARRTGTS
jgi:hypothetical protein